MLFCLLQPLTQLPRSHETYLDREHCLLCRRVRPDPLGHKAVTPATEDGKENSSQVAITQVKKSHYKTVGFK